MIARLSLVSTLLVSSSVLSMQNDYIEIPLDNMGTTANAHCITSLDHWKEFASKSESLGDYEVLPQAVAEFQQKHEIKTNLPLLPEAIRVWSDIKNSQEYAQGYKVAVLRIHALLRGENDIQPHAELSDLKDVFLKKSYEQLALIKKNILVMQQDKEKIRKWALGLSAAVTVVLVVFILEFVHLVGKK